MFGKRVAVPSTVCNSFMSAVKVRTNTYNEISWRIDCLIIHMLAIRTCTYLDE